jgi:hypothetical protein
MATEYVNGTRKTMRLASKTRMSPSVNQSRTGCPRWPDGAMRGVDAPDGSG